MSTLLAGTVQPSLLGLLNSSSNPPLSSLWTTRTDPSDPSTSFVHAIADTDLRPKVARRKWDAAPDERTHIPQHQPKRGTIQDRVVHLQGKKARKTYIQIGRSKTEMTATGAKRRRLSIGEVNEEGAGQALGVELPWVHLQLKRLGQRGMAFEVGVVDVKGREGIIRYSSSQKEPTIHRYRSPPLLHLPLQLAEQTENSMTPWMDIGVNTSQLLSLFQTLPDPDSSASEDASDQEGQDRDREPASGKSGRPKRPKPRSAEEVPNTQFASISYLRLYANCRVKRIWLSAEGERTFDGLGTTARRDFALLAAPQPEDDG